MIINGSSKIIGLGISLPNQRVSSISLMEEIESERRFGIPHDWIDRRVGIVERRVAAEGTKTSDLAYEASINAINNAGITNDDLDMILYCGIEGDVIEPGTAHFIQNRLQTNASCLDIRNACQGMISGLAVANAMIASGAIETALICSGELTSRVMFNFMREISSRPDEYMRDRLGFLTVGDAGSAIVLRKADSDAGVQKIIFDSRGEYADFCYYKYVNEVIEGQMLMRGITEKIASIHFGMISNTYHYLDWEPRDVDHLLCHQVGAKSLEKLCEIAEVPIHKAPAIYKDFGNITTCTIPLSLYFAKPNKGDKILLIGGGSGLSSYQGGIIW
ncbi:ketoacyl-ACP synthase III [Gammaproteobacteria bacterium]|nr:ketoacyl-ACP synthase III [Gammaproteobacteria bacterium]